MKKYSYILALAFLGIFPSFAFAGNFPNDAKTINFGTEGTITSGNITTVPAGHTWTLLEVCATSNSNYDIVTANGTNLVYTMNNAFGTSNDANSGQICWRGTYILTAGQQMGWNKVSAGYASIAGFVTYVDYDLTLKATDNSLFTNIKDNTAGTNTALTGIHNDILATNTALTNINASINASSGASQTAILTAINDNIIATNSKLDSTLTATNNLYNFLNGGLLADFLKYGIIGISAFFIIWLISFLYKWFFRF